MSTSGLVMEIRVKGSNPLTDSLKNYGPLSDHFEYTLLLSCADN